MSRLPKYTTEEPNFNKELSRLRSLKNQAAEAVKVLEETKNLKTSANSVIAELAKLKEEADNLTTNIEEAIGEIQPSIRQAEDPQNGIAAIYKQAVEKNTEITKFSESARRLNTKLEQQIIRVGQISTLASDQLEKITASGLSGGFTDRAKAINNSKIKWGKALFWSAGILIVILAALYIDVRDQTSFDFSAASAFRISLVAPAVFMVTFAARQYSKERDLLEQYEFKASVSASLPSYIKLLKDEYVKDGEFVNKEHKGQIKDSLMTINVKWVDNIYALPQQDIDKNSDESINFWHSFFRGRESKQKIIPKE